MQNNALHAIDFIGAASGLSRALSQSSLNQEVVG
jgi:hypothetical protein